MSIKRCPNAVATGSLHDPYTNAIVAFMRGEKTGAAVQIEHIVPLAYAWDMGARNWTDELRVRFANDPANLLAVGGQVNQDKGDKEPAAWMPPNTAFHCQYAMQFIAVFAATGCLWTRRRQWSCVKLARRALRAEPVLERSSFSNPTRFPDKGINKALSFSPHRYAGQLSSWPSGVRLARLY